MEINVLIDKEYREHLDLKWLKSIPEQVLIAHGAETNVELGLVITSQERVQQLNRSYRGIDEPTDVLAFAMFPESPATEKTAADSPPFVTPPDGMLHLGEVIISYPQSMIQAEEHGHSTQKEIILLIIHGILHLLGYDHVTPELEYNMRDKEAELWSRIEGEES